MTNEGNCVPSCDENRIAQYRMMLYNLQRKPRANTTNLESIDQCWSEIHCIALLPWIVVLRMQMQSLMFFFWGGDFHASVLSFLEPATSACSWHVKMHDASLKQSTTSETIRNAAEPHRADNYWQLVHDTSGWFMQRMVPQNTKANFVNFFPRCCAPSQGPTKKTSWHVVTCARPCQTQTWLMHNPTLLACTDCLRSSRK